MLRSTVRSHAVPITRQAATARTTAAPLARSNLASQQSFFSGIQAKPMTYGHQIRNYSVDKAPSPKNPTLISIDNFTRPEIAPLVIFVGTVAAAGIIAVTYHLFRDEDLRIKSGDSIVNQNDDALKKALAEPDPKPPKEKSVGDAKQESRDKNKTG